MSLLTVFHHHLTIQETEGNAASACQSLVRNIVGIGRLLDNLELQQV